MFCSKCHTEIPDEKDVYCKRCGTKIQKKNKLDFGSFSSSKTFSRMNTKNIVSDCDTTNKEENIINDKIDSNKPQKNKENKIKKKNNIENNIKTKEACDPSRSSLRRC